jgi:hypothetical protein
MNIKGTLCTKYYSIFLSGLTVLISNLFSEIIKGKISISKNTVIVDDSKTEVFKKIMNYTKRLHKYIF